MSVSEKELWAYRLSTALICIVLLLSAWSYFFHTPTIEGILALGFPAYFRIELGVLKIIAAVVLLIPSVPNRCKEWAYAGAALFFLTALVAHIVHQDPVGISVLLIFCMTMLAVSNHYFHKQLTAG